MGEGRERRPRGVLLGSLDRSQRYVIGYVGRRWEVVGVLDGEPSAAPAAPVEDPRPGGGPARAQGAPAPSTGGETPARASAPHRAPGAHRKPPPPPPGL